MRQKPLTAVAQETRKNHTDSEQGLYRSLDGDDAVYSSSPNIQADSWGCVLQFCSHACF